MRPDPRRAPPCGTRRAPPVPDDSTMKWTVSIAILAISLGIGSLIFPFFLTSLAKFTIHAIRRFAAFRIIMSQIMVNLSNPGDGILGWMVTSMMKE